MNSATRTETTLPKATIYFRSPFGLGYKRVEVKDLRAWRGKFAQYDSAVFCEFMLRRARSRRSCIDTQGSSPSLVVLEGWGHPEPGEQTELLSDDGSVAVSRFRHSGHSPEWDIDFDAFLTAYTERSGVKVAADFRGVNTRAPLQVAS